MKNTFLELTSKLAIKNTDVLDFEKELYIDRNCQQSFHMKSFTRKQLVMFICVLDSFLSLSVRINPFS